MVHFDPDAPFEFGPSQYKLVAVIHHLGKSLNSGHYVSYILCGDIWMLFDDDRVSSVSPHSIHEISGEGP